MPALGTCTCTVDARLLTLARRHGVHVSSVLQEALAAELRTRGARVPVRLAASVPDPPRPLSWGVREALVRRGLTPERLRAMPRAEALAALDALQGVGRHTAERILDEARRGR